METGSQPLLQFIGVSILELSYKAEKGLTYNDPLKLNVTPYVYYPKENKFEFQLIMDLILESEGIFNLSLTAIGTFQCNSELDEKIRTTFVNANTPAIMFPYVRAFVTTFTANIGSMLIPIVLPPQFFKGEIEEYIPPQTG